MRYCNESSRHPLRFSARNGVRHFIHPLTMLVGAIMPTITLTDQQFLIISTALGIARAAWAADAIVCEHVHPGLADQFREYIRDAVTIESRIEEITS